MKKNLIFICIMLITLPLFAQRNRIETDIFDNLQYTSSDGKYKAELKEDIFDNLIFSDSNKNKITYKKEYLDSEYRGMPQNEKAKTDFFHRLIRQYRTENNYEASYSIDIMGTTIFKDNRGNQTKKGVDIFGNPTYEEKIDGVEMSIKRSINGALEYKSGKENATLRKNIFDKWCYEDSNGNKFEFGEKTWNSLIRRFKNDEGVFSFLIGESFR